MQNINFQDLRYEILKSTCEVDIMISKNKEKQSSLEEVASSKEDSLVLSDDLPMSKTHESIVIERSFNKTPSINHSHKESLILREFPECEQIYSLAVFVKKIEKLDDFDSQLYSEECFSKLSLLIQDLSKTKVVALVKNEEEIQNEVFF